MKTKDEILEELYESIITELHVGEAASAFDNALKQFDRAAAVLNLSSNQVAIIK